MKTTEIFKRALLTVILNAEKPLGRSDIIKKVEGDYSFPSEIHTLIKKGDPNKTTFEDKIDDGLKKLTDEKYIELVDKTYRILNAGIEYINSNPLGEIDIKSMMGVLRNTAIKGPTYWFVTAKPELYDYSAAFRETEEIPWDRKTLKKFRLNDVIYLYNSSTHRVDVKAVVVDPRPDIQSVKRFSKYWSRDYKYNDPFMIRLVSRIECDGLRFEELKTNGFKFNQSGKKLKPEEVTYFENAICSGRTGFPVYGNHPLNLIISGIPGSGKSYYVGNTLLKLYSVDNDHIVRTVFHPEYSNSDFIGQYMPTSDRKRPYRFIPGPFTRALFMSLKEPNKKVALVIEELNRGDCAGIFGEIFQLLDRVDNGEKRGCSRYPIYSYQISEYIVDEWDTIYGALPIKNNMIFIPSNLLLIATMNTSDQNLFTMDTAFTRRWVFKRYFTETCDYSEYLVPFKDSTCDWGTFVKRINQKIVNTGSILNSEDKQLGVYFVDKDLLLKEGEPYSKDKSEYFANKVLGYIWTNVANRNRSLFFASNLNTFDKVLKKFEDDGLGVFAEGIFD